MTWSVWLVTDNEAIRHLFVKTFEKRKDLDFKAWATVEEAREALKSFLPHVLILSINLPDGDGYNLCRALKEEGATFPILLIEDIFEDIDPDHCLKVGADGFISKPFEGDLIEEKVNEILNSLNGETRARPGKGQGDNQSGDIAEMGENRVDEVPSPKEKGSGEGSETGPSVPEEGIELVEEEGDEGIIDLTDLLEEETPKVGVSESPSQEEVPQETDIPLEGEPSPEITLSEETPFPEETVSEGSKEDVLEENPQGKGELKEIPLEEIFREEVPLPEETLKEETPASKIPSEEGTVPPFISSVLEESLQELEAMEAMEAPPLAESEEQPLSEAEPGVQEERKPELEPEQETKAEPSLPPMGQEALEEKVREVVASVVQETLEDRLPNMMRESLARLLTEISAFLK